MKACILFGQAVQRQPADFGPGIRTGTGYPGKEDLPRGFLGVCRDSGNRRWGWRCGRLAGINGGFLKAELVQLAGIEQVSRQPGLIADLVQKEVAIRLAGMVRRGIKVLLTQNDAAGLIDPKAGTTPNDDQRRLTGERLLANGLDGLIFPIFQKIGEQEFASARLPFQAGGRSGASWPSMDRRIWFQYRIPAGFFHHASRPTLAKVRGYAW